MDQIAPKKGRQLVERLIATHEPRIRRFIRARSGPMLLERVSVEDIFQETVSQAVGSADTFEFVDDNRFVGWIGTIARRVIARSSAAADRNVATIRIRRPNSSGPGIADNELQGGGRTPSSLAAHGERKVGLRAALENLPPHYRKAMILYKLEERPLAEVAREMGRTKGATCRLIARATVQLRQLLSKQ